MAPEAPVSPAGEASISAGDLFRWRRSMLALVPLEGAAPPEGRAAFDWLLDVVGGVSWTTLQGLWLHPGGRVSLARPRSLIESLWRKQKRYDEVEDEVQRIFRDRGVIDKANDLLTAYEEQAVKSLRLLTSPTLKGLLRRVIGKIFGQETIEGYCSEFETRNAASRQAGSEPAR